MAKPAAKAVPDGMHTITPHLVCGDAIAAIDFYKRAFNAVELMRLPGPDGKLMHAQLRIGDSLLMLAEENPKWAFSPLTLKGSPVTIHLQVENVDAVVEQAVAAGAKMTMPVSEMFWGDRYGYVVDPFGHQWAVATHTRDLTHDEIVEGMNAMLKQMPC